MSAAGTIAPPEVTPAQQETFRKLSLDVRSHFYGYDRMSEIPTEFLINWVQADGRIAEGGTAKFPRADWAGLAWREEREHIEIELELNCRGVFL